MAIQQDTGVQGPIEGLWGHRDVFCLGFKSLGCLRVWGSVPRVKGFGGCRD